MIVKVKWNDDDISDLQTDQLEKTRTNTFLLRVVVAVLFYNFKDYNKNYYLKIYLYRYIYLIDFYKIITSNLEIVNRRKSSYSASQHFCSHIVAQMSLALEWLKYTRHMLSTTLLMQNAPFHTFYNENDFCRLNLFHIKLFSGRK